jgi:hypothetical protein
MVYQNISLLPNDCDIDINKLINKFGNDKFEVVQFKVGYVSGKSANPLNNITFYDLKTYKIISENKVRSFSLLINQKYQEYFYRVYCLDLSLIEDFKQYINDISKKENKQLIELHPDQLHQVDSPDRLTRIYQIHQVESPVELQPDQIHQVESPIELQPAKIHQVELSA